MYSNRTWSNALGKVAQSRIPSVQVSPEAKAKAKEEKEAQREKERQAAETTYAKIKSAIEDNDRWHQSESREVFENGVALDPNGVPWRLTVSNIKSRLYVRLTCDGDGANRRWESERLQVGGIVEKENDRFGFAVTVEFSAFEVWRRKIQRTRPVTRKSPVTKY